MAEVTTRRRYDTIALVQKLQRERRRGLVLGFCGAGILVALVIVYALQIRGSDIPQVPTDVTPRPTVGQPAVTGFGAMAPPATEASLDAKADASTAAREIGAPSTGPTSANGEPSAPGSASDTASASAQAATAARLPAKEEPPPPAQLHAAIPNGAALWIDNAVVPRGNSSVTLKPGVHAVRAKVGKRVITQKLEVAAGEAVELRVDAKHKKIAIERRTVASKHD